AIALQVEPPAEVILTNYSTVFTFYFGGTAWIGGRQVLLLGLPLIQTLTISQLEAYIFRELAQRNMRLGIWVDRTMVAIQTAATSLGALTRPFEWYGRLFSKAALPGFRQDEAHADALAAATYGADTLIDALSASVRIGRVAIDYVVY